MVPNFIKIAPFVLSLLGMLLVFIVYTVVVVWGLDEDWRGCIPFLILLDNLIMLLIFFL